MKKIISLILILGIVFTSFVSFADEYLPDYEYVDDIFRFDVGEFSENADTEENKNDIDSKRIALLYEIGIWDDVSKNKDAFLTKTEFSVIMANLKLGKDNALKDVYLLKDNEDNDKATFLDAYTYLLETLGYFYKCAEYGNTPESVLAVSAETGLVSGETQNKDAFITRNELSKLIMKALETDICVKEDVDGGYKYTVSAGETLLNKVHSVYNVSGFVNAVPGLSVYGGTTLKKGFIQINRKNINASGFNANAYLGRGVNAYAKFDESLNQLVLIYIDYSDEYECFEIDFRNIGDIDNFNVSYLENDVENEIDISNLKYITENGDKLATVSELSDFKTNEGKILLTASEKNGDIDTAIVYKYDYYIVEYNDLMLNRIGLKYHKKHDGNKYIQIDEKAVNSVTINGKPSEVKNIESGSAIRVVRCMATGYTEIIASTEKVTEEVSVISDNYIEAGRKEYYLPEDLLSHIEQIKNESLISYDDKIHPLEIGKRYTFYIVGNVVAGYKKADSFDFAYIKSVSTTKTSIEPEIYVKMFTSEGEWQEYKVKDKIELDGEKNVAKEKLLEIIQSKRGTSEDIINNICRYKINSYDEITVIDTVYENPVYEGETSDDMKFHETFNSYINWTYWNLGVNTKYFIDERTVIFVIPDNKDKEKAYRVVTNTELPTGQGNEIKMDLYNSNAFLHIRAAVVHGELGITSSGGEVAMYIESIRKTIINAEEQTYGYRIMGTQTINGRQKGKGSLGKISYFVEEEEFEEKPFSVGDFVSIDTQGSMLLAWETILPGGVIPDVDSKQTVKGDDGSDFFIINGRIKKVDTVSHLVLIEVNGEECVYSPRSLGVIDTASGKIHSATISDFHENERVYLYGNLGNATYLIKNKVQ